MSEEDGENIESPSPMSDRFTGPLPEKLTSGGVALAELAFDIDPAGIYPVAQTLRNAGTHRLVNQDQQDALPDEGRPHVLIYKQP